MTFHINTWSRHSTQLTGKQIEYWSGILSTNESFSEIASSIPNTLGVERRLDIIWMALMMPLLMNDPSNQRSPFLQNVEHLTKIYSNGVDLFSSETIRSLDTDDIVHIFPSARDESVYSDCLEVLRHMQQFRKQHPSLLQHIQSQNTLDALVLHATAWGSEVSTFQLLSILPFIESVLVSGHHSFEQDLQREYIDAITAHAIWCSGDLDAIVGIDDDDLPENLLTEINGILGALSVQFELLPGTLIRKLHSHLYQTTDSQRIWLWGHTARGQ